MKIKKSKILALKKSILSGNFIILKDFNSHLNLTYNKPKP